MKYKKKSRKPKDEKKLAKIDLYRHINKAIKVAGLETPAKRVNRRVTTTLALIYVISLTLISIYLLLYNTAEFFFLFMVASGVFILVTLLGYLFFWIAFLLVLDYLKFMRKTEIERILPEFFRLVSANHRAGLSFEKALWKSNKPRFGILSKEINIVAKSSYTKSSLIDALNDFSEKYDSVLLKRFVNILGHGLKSGSNISDLLDDIAANASRIMNTRKDMATDVMNYIFFILIAVIVICPFMFGVGRQLTENVYYLKTTIDLDDIGVASQFSAFSTPVKSSPKFFDTFANITIFTNCLLSIMMISLIFHGNIFYNITRVPIMLIFSYLIYYVVKYLIGSFLALG